MLKIIKTRSISRSFLKKNHQSSFLREIIFQAKQLGVKKKTVKDNLETITLKKPNDIYLDMYKEFRIKAREARKSALLAYLEAKKIKNVHMLDIDDSSDNEYEKQLETTTPNNLEKLQ